MGNFVSKKVSNNSAHFVYKCLIVNKNVSNKNEQQKGKNNIS